jgi:hypothetical protein
MRLSPEEKGVLDSVAERGSAIVERAVVWSDINSGSRNLEGLETVRGLLKDAFAVLPTEPRDIALEPSIEIGADGRETEQAHPPSMAVIVRPEAPVQVVLTGHYDTVYPAGSRFQTVGTRARSRHHALAQRGHERRMAGQNAEVALGARGVDTVDLPREHLALRRDQREVELVGHQAASMAIFSALATASSIVPTM